MSPDRGISVSYPVEYDRAVKVVLCVIIVVLWLIVDLWILTPAQAGLDVYYFKDAAINLADGLGFVSRFTYGNPSFDYHTYAQYPPLYPLLYGLFLKGFGVSLESNQIFNSLISVFCSLAGFALLKPLIPRPDRAIGFAAFLALFCLCLISGFFKPDADRPDALAVALGLCVYNLLRWRTERVSSACAGALCGLVFFISPFVSIFTSLTAGVLIVQAEKDTDDQVFLSRCLLSACLGGLIATAVILTAIFVMIPDWWSGFVGVFLGSTTNNETGGGYFRSLLSGDVGGWANAFVDFTSAGVGTLVVNLGKLAAAAGILALAIVVDLLVAGRSHARSRDWVFMAALVAIAPIGVILIPYQFNYMRISASMLLAAAACIAVALPSTSRRIYAPAILFAFFLINLVTLPQIVRDEAIRMTTGPSLARAEAFIRAHRTELEAPNTVLAVASPTYLLFRQEGLRPLALVYSGFDDKDNRARITYLALNYSRSVDPLKPEAPAWFNTIEFQSLFTPQLPQPAIVAGYRLSSGSQTWESSLFERSH